MCNVLKKNPVYRIKKIKNVKCTFIINLICTKESVGKGNSRSWSTNWRSLGANAPTHKRMIRTFPFLNYAIQTNLHDYAIRLKSEYETCSCKSTLVLD